MNKRPLPYDHIALLLQGGGALGAYQAGVYEGLVEAGIEPNWVAGVSIGALNSAVIAGSPPGQRLDRLQDFWQTICQPALLGAGADWLQKAAQQFGGTVRTALNSVEATRAIVEGQRGFFVPRLPPPWLVGEQPATTLSHYDILPLKATLERLVDFDRINAGETRVTVSAVNIRTGNYERFDNRRGRWKGRLGVEHFMASGALPPSFPAIEIEGECYWDGGLVLNTPLVEVVSDTPRRDTLAFQVDLWSAHGDLPRNLFAVEERVKDIRFSSRTRAVTDVMAREQQLRCLLREVLAQVPEDRRTDSAACRVAMDEAADRKLVVLHLIYQDKEWDGLSKDYEFGPLTMREHWASGLADMRKTLAQPGWLEPPAAGAGMKTHDIHRERAPGPRGAAEPAAAGRPNRGGDRGAVPTGRRPRRHR